jgi:hypothetical protein
MRRGTALQLSKVFAPTAGFSVVDPHCMMRTYGPAEGLTQPLPHAWRLWVNINATRCRLFKGVPWARHSENVSLLCYHLIPSMRKQAVAALMFCRAWAAERLRRWTRSYADSQFQLRACANRRATFRTWHLSERLNSLLTTAWHIRYSPIGAAS